MSIELTEDQRQAVLRGQPVRVFLPELGGEVVVLRVEDFENLQDQRLRQAFREAGLRSAIRWLQDNPY